jgi:hypothetical protein
MLGSNTNGQIFLFAGLGEAPKLKAPFLLWPLALAFSSDPQ